MKMLHAVIVKSRTASDLVSITTDLKEGCWPYDGPLCLEFHCAANSAADFMARHFPDVLIKETIEPVPNDHKFTNEDGYGHGV